MIALTLPTAPKGIGYLLPMSRWRCQRNSGYKPSPTPPRLSRNWIDAKDDYWNFKRLSIKLEWARGQRSQWITHLCKKLDAAMRLCDVRQFYHHLCVLGVPIKGKSFEDRSPSGLRRWFFSYVKTDDEVARAHPALCCR